MEAAFGASFGDVRTHSDAGAAEMSRAIGAAAFTHGSHIFLGAGRFDPYGRDGRRLLAHELTHVIQQNPHVAGRGSLAERGLVAQRGPVVARGQANVLQRDEPQGPSGAEAPPGKVTRKVQVSFIGEKAGPILTLPFTTNTFDSLEPGFYDCVSTSETALTGHLTAEGLTSPYTAHEGFPGGWRKLLGLTRRTGSGSPTTPASSTPARRTRRKRSRAPGASRASRPRTPPGASTGCSASSTRRSGSRRHSTRRSRRSAWMRRSNRSGRC
jgi:hypothetical protein